MKWVVAAVFVLAACYPQYPPTRKPEHLCVVDHYENDSSMTCDATSCYATSGQRAVYRCYPSFPEPEIYRRWLLPDYVDT